MPERRHSAPGARSFWVVVGVFFVLGLLFGCDYARMKDDEALQTYESSLPEMPKQTVPVAGGVEILRQADPRSLENPVPPGPSAVERGKTAYGYYCVQCHGPKADGYGTVGQSFAPPPSDLVSSDVQDQSDGELYYKISLGWNRHPPLAFTAAEDERWAIVHYMRSLAENPNKTRHDRGRQ